MVEAILFLDCTKANTFDTELKLSAMILFDGLLTGSSSMTIKVTTAAATSDALVAEGFQFTKPSWAIWEKVKLGFAVSRLKTIARIAVSSFNYSHGEEGNCVSSY